MGMGKKNAIRYRVLMAVLMIGSVLFCIIENTSIDHKPAKEAIRDFLFYWPWPEDDTSSISLEEFETKTDVEAILSANDLHCSVDIVWKQGDKVYFIGDRRLFPELYCWNEEEQKLTRTKLTWNHLSTDLYFVCDQQPYVDQNGFLHMLVYTGYGTECKCNKLWIFDKTGRLTEAKEMGDIVGESFVVLPDDSVLYENKEHHVIRWSEIRQLTETKFQGDCRLCRTEEDKVFVKEYDRLNDQWNLWKLDIETGRRSFIRSESRVEIARQDLETSENKTENPEGNICRELFFGEDEKLEYWNVYTYDSDNKKETVTVFNGEGNQIDHGKYDYNDAGSVITDYYNGAYGYLTRVRIVYDEFGRVSIKEIFPSTGGDYTENYQYSNNDEYYYKINYSWDVHLWKYDLFDRDSEGRIIKRDHYDAKGILCGFEISTYDVYGNHIRDDTYEYIENSTDKREEHRYKVREYGKSGELVNEKSFDEQGVLFNRETYEYNGNGRMISKKSYDENGNMIGGVVYEY